MPSPKTSCVKCGDTGRIYDKETATEGKFAGKIYTVVKDCICKPEMLRNKRLAEIPHRFKSVILREIEPDPEIHPLQEKIIPLMKETPFDNYFLAGETGKGKTMMLWALYREALMADKKVVACTLTQLLNEYKNFINLSTNKQELVYPRLSAGELRQDHTRYSIFLDDLDKAKPSEYAMEQLFELSNAIYEFGHQIVVTTNLRYETLVKHFEKADERFGATIARRLVADANLCEMF